MVFAADPGSKHSILVSKVGLPSDALFDANTNGGICSRPWQHAIRCLFYCQILTMVFAADPDRNVLVRFIVFAMKCWEIDYLLCWTLLALNEQTEIRLVVEQRRQDSRVLLQRGHSSLITWTQPCSPHLCNHNRLPSAIGLVESPDGW